MNETSFETKLCSIKVAGLKRTALFQELSDEALRSIAALAVPRHFRKDDIIFVAGEKAQGVYVIVNGSVRAFFSAAQVPGAEMLAPNSSLNFNYPNQRDSAISIRTADGAYSAYGQQCTHLACLVYYSPGQQRLECPCHEGAFDARSGNVLYGPPPRPLDTIELETRNGQVWAIGRKLRVVNMQANTGLQPNATTSTNERRQLGVFNIDKLCARLTKFGLAQPCVVFV